MIVRVERARKRQAGWHRREKRFIPVPAVNLLGQGFFLFSVPSAKRGKESPMKDVKAIPYKIYLEENEMPKYWYNVRADMKNKPAPLLNPGTLKPMKAE